MGGNLYREPMEEPVFDIKESKNISDDAYT